MPYKLTFYKRQSLQTVKIGISNRVFTSELFHIQQILMLPQENTNEISCTFLVFRHIIVFSFNTYNNGIDSKHVSFICLFIFLGGVGRFVTSYLRGSDLL